MKKNYDYTAANRMAAMRERLIESGGKRMSFNLDKSSVDILDKMIENGEAQNYTEAIKVKIAQVPRD